MYCSFLGEQEKATTDKTIMNDTYNDRLFTQNTSCFDDNTDKKNVDIESKLRMEGYNSKLECSKNDRKISSSIQNHCAGYDCSVNKSFLVQPDSFNTSHNYSVLQEKQIHGKDVYCANNHQYFNNFTRRNVGAMTSTEERGGLPADVEKIPELKYNVCDLYPKPVEMKCSFP